MRIGLTEKERQFRDDAATWLRENVPLQARPSDGDAMREFDSAWQRRQFDGGWAGVSWPEEHGGRGMSLREQMLWYEQYALADAPPAGLFTVALGHVGPSLIADGTDRQRERHLLPILRGEQTWAQGFSEPNAGSDLAGVRTSACVDGDDLIVNGHKTWSSYADHCAYQALLLRTDAGSTRQRGLSWVICDLRSPGVEVRPIRTMDGGARVCEVFYQDVRVPLLNVVGGLGNGWRVAMATLDFERGSASVVEVVRLTKLVDRVTELARECTGPDGRLPAIADAEIADRVATARFEVAALGDDPGVRVSDAGDGQAGRRFIDGSSLLLRAGSAGQGTRRRHPRRRRTCRRCTRMRRALRRRLPVLVRPHARRRGRQRSSAT